jgi:hypothetical protein
MLIAPGDTNRDGGHCEASGKMTSPQVIKLSAVNSSSQNIRREVFIVKAAQSR